MKTKIEGNVMSVKEVGEVIGFFEDKWYCVRYNNSVKDEVRIVYKFYGGWNRRKLGKRDRGMEEIKRIFEKDGWKCEWYESWCSVGDGSVLCFRFSKKK